MNTPFSCWRLVWSPLATYHAPEDTAFARRTAITVENKDAARPPNRIYIRLVRILLQRWRALLTHP